MNGMIFRSFPKRNSSQKNTNTIYSEYSYSGIVPKERSLHLHTGYVNSPELTQKIVKAKFERRSRESDTLGIRGFLAVRFRGLMAEG